MMRAFAIAAACALGLVTPALAQTPTAPAAPSTPSGEIWDLDQLRVARDVPEEKMKALEPAHSLDAAIKTLTDLGVAFTRTHVRIVADKLPEELRNALLALPPGEPFILPENEFWSVSVIVGRSLPPGSVRFLFSPHTAPLRKV
ncbi:hypothetical protein FHS31_003155 [Sphingomonas vulcanisoli]|uniref:Uncharacterized protein n=1 Tax=Sphingomonas vulcanisoli TaxID=1658060 RepID=A0ABX0TYF6_9SPHN|nr:hypothetical protein [Sphingomonas vulcanisoli]NIJ09522.1 hypothetical protein [Sphingomonas vulcanisoli]